MWWLKETPLMSPSSRMAQSGIQDPHIMHQQALKFFFQSVQDKHL